MPVVEIALREDIDISNMISLDLLPLDKMMKTTHAWAKVQNPMCFLDPCLYSVLYITSVIYDHRPNLHDNKNRGIVSNSHYSMTHLGPASESQMLKARARHMGPFVYLFTCQDSQHILCIISSSVESCTWR